MLSTRDRIIYAGIAAVAAVLLASVMNNNATAAPKPDPAVDHGNAVPLKGVPINDTASGLVYNGLKAAQQGPCVGAYQITGVDFTMCTHGPDPAPAGLDVKRPIQPLAVGNGDLNNANAGTQALAVCEGDGVSGRSYLSQFFNVADNLFLIRGGQTTPSPTPSVTPSSGAPFRLINGASSTCLDVPNSNTTDGTQLIIWSCNNGANQNFTQSGQTLRVLGKCVTAFNSGTANGTRVVLSTCNNGANQNWTSRPDGSIAGIQSGRCIQPTGGATGNGAQIILQDCNGQPSQRWTRS